MVEKEQKEGKKRTFQKSRPYPPYDISVASKFAAIIEKLGARNVSEPILLKELGLKTFTRSFWGKAASAKQFGLIIVDRKIYTLTERARLILRPKDEDSKKNLLVEAFLTPELYKELCEKFREKQIPPMESLANILFHDHGIKSVDVSKDSARAFIDSARYVGLLGPDNVLKSSTESEETTLPTEHKDISLMTQRTTVPVAVSATIELSKGIASITLPKGGITRKDNDRLRKLIDAYVVEDEPIGQKTISAEEETK